MSNKAEILAEYEAAHSELTQLETNAVDMQEPPQPRKRAT